MTQKLELVDNLRTQRGILSQNEGKTAEDLAVRYFRGEQSELDKAEKYEIKADALSSGADAIDYLRGRLTEIANAGDREIENILSSKKPLPEQLEEIHMIQLQCNADAANASRASVDKIVAATQKILDAEGIGADARSWARDHGFNVDDVPPPCPIGKDELTSSPVASGGRSTGVGGTPGDAPNAGAPGPQPAVAGDGGLASGGGSLGNFTGADAPTSSPRPVVSASGHAASGPIPAGPPTTLPAPTTPPGMLPGIPAAPGLPGGSFSPAAAGQGISPTSVGQSFATGMMTGQPAAAGAQSLSAGTMHAIESGATPGPQTASPLPTPAPVAAPTIAATGIESAAIHPSVDTSATAAGTPVMAAGDTGTAAVAPTVVTSAPMSAPVMPAVGQAVPAGPLPAYGSDLRPPAVTAGPTPSAVAAPVSGAPVAPSASSSPSAGGRWFLRSSAQRRAPPRVGRSVRAGRRCRQHRQRRLHRERPPVRCLPGRPSNNG